MQMLKIPKPTQVKRVDVLAGLAYVASGGLTSVFALGGPRWVLVGAAFAGTAGLLARLFKNPTDAPATAIVANAPIVPPGTPPAAIHESTVGTNTHTEP